MLKASGGEEVEERERHTVGVPAVLGDMVWESMSLFSLLYISIKQNLNLLKP